MRRVRSIGVMSLGKVMGYSGALLGLIFGIFYGLVVVLASIVGGLSSEGSSGIAAIGVAGGIGIVIAAPVLYGLMSFVFGLLYAVILNLVLGWAGGLEIELE